MLADLPVKKYLRIPVVVQRTAMRAAQHDVLNLAQSAAYSAMVSLFPALIVAASLLALLPSAAHIRAQLGVFFDRTLPSDVIPLLEGYFAPTRHARSIHVLIVTILVSVTGASTVITTFMEGLRRAHNLPVNCWTFWGRRIRALILVPLSLIPMAIASSFVVFGHILTAWLVMHVAPEVGAPVFVLALVSRWFIEFIGSVGLLALLYHMGTPLRQPWKHVIPGAIAATAMWLLTTLVFGWYVTRFANYTQVYGSLGAGIALLFWLYIVSLSVLCGAEFNEQFQLHIQNEPAVNQTKSIV